MFDNPEFIVLRGERLCSWFIYEGGNDKRNAVDCITFYFSLALQDVPLNAGFAYGVGIYDL
jgi:hypothetical protein